MSAQPRTHRELILDAALATILSKGYPGMRVDEVCSTAGVTKGSFYHHFESKEHLAHELVDHYFNQLMGALEAGAWTGIEDSSERLFAFLDHVLSVVEGPFLKPGCLLASFALDLGETHPSLRARLEERFDRLVAVVEGLLTEAARSAGPGPELKPRMLARQFVAVLQGSIVMAKAYGDHGLLAEGMRCHVALLRELLRS